ncbi:MAG: hypothetical protein Q8N63_01915 [Nanoarchaeota archaeon]|nr:hypothetical protein [Nanoarchaeota archaeon]
MEPKYTKSGLPVVSEDICRTLTRDFSQRYREGRSSLSKYLNSRIKNITKSNPELADLLDGALEAFGEKDSQIEATLLVGAIIVYDALNKQAETNKLEADLND